MDRFLRRLGLALWHCRVALMYLAAYLWRRILFRTTFIAITGSVGKTTCKECLAAALSSRHPTAKSFANQNDFSGVPRSLLRVRPWHRFAVLEVATNGLGGMRRSARLLQPDLAIVLAIARTYGKNFQTLEKIAAEKAELLTRLRKSGVAILNGDDPLVAGMAAGLRRRVVRFGASPTFDYWADAVCSQWPERLSFEIHAGTNGGRVQTQLAGAHWKTSVLAAIAAAHVCGVALDDITAAVGTVAPAPGRMQPAPLPCAAIVIRDDMSGSMETLRPALEMFSTATAARKILVLSDVTDTRLKPRDRLRGIGREAAAIFDSVVFIGDSAQHGVRGAIAGGLSAECAHAFVSQPQAVEFLKNELREGDLVLLRGHSNEHIARLYFALCGSVACRRTRCEKRILCDVCPELGAMVPLMPAPAPALHKTSPPLPGSRPEDAARIHPSPAARC